MGGLDLYLTIDILAFIYLFIYFVNIQMKKWESWEAETRTLEYQFTNGKL